LQDNYVDNLALLYFSAEPVLVLKCRGRGLRDVLIVIVQINSRYKDIHYVAAPVPRIAMRLDLPVTTMNGLVIELLT